MCIICLKPAGVDLPSDQEIKHMFTRNPDGAGFALQGDIHGDGGFKVEYHKGFMNVDDLLEALGPREKLKDLTVAIHCRIKTSGETDKFTTHPFPISNQYSELRELDGEGPVLFHNGVFASLGGKADPKSSDTQDFVIGVATRYLKNAKMPGKIAQAVVQEIIGASRVLVLYPKKGFPMLKIGTWVEHNGCFYSNQGWRTETPSYSYGSSLSYGAYHKKKQTNQDNKYHLLDAMGRNNAEYAWPNDTDDWISFSEQRWSSLEKAMEDKEEDERGTITCKFRASGNKTWIVDDENMEIYTEDMEDEILKRREQEDFMAERLADGEIWYEDDGYIYFGDQNQLIDWTEVAEKDGQYTYKFLGEIWYVDTVEFAAYTNEGLKNYLGTGKAGHARKEIEDHGYFVDHSYDRRYGYPTDDDEDEELTKFTKLDEDIQEELELEGYGRS